MLLEYCIPDETCKTDENLKNSRIDETNQLIKLLRILDGKLKRRH